MYTGTNLKSVVILVAAVLLCTPALARKVDWSAFHTAPSSVGLYSSFKGFGLGVGFQKDDRVSNNITLRGDWFGCFGRSSAPSGFALDYSRRTILRCIDTDEVRYVFYTGAGATVGIARDWEKGYFKTGELSAAPGLVAGITATGGCRFVFAGAFDIGVGFTGAMAFKSRITDGGHINASLYKNGIFRLPYPEITVHLKF